MFPLIHAISPPEPTIVNGWWDDNGNISGALAAWQAKGAASYAASLEDLTGNGHTLVEKNGAVPWSTEAGWEFVTADGKLLVMPIVPQSNNYSYLVQYTGAGSNNEKPLIGYYVSIIPKQFGVSLRYRNGSEVSVAPYLDAGNLGIAGTRGYRNGVAEGAAMTGNPNATTIGIGANWNGSAFSDHITADIIAVAVYNVVLSADDMATIAGNMAAL